MLKSYLKARHPLRALGVLLSFQEKALPGHGPPGAEVDETGPSGAELPEDEIPGQELGGPK